MRRPIAAAVAVVVATLVLVLVVPASPASAHGDTATVDEVGTSVNPDGSYTVDVLLVYDDGDPVEGADVVVTADVPGFGPIPITMEPGDRPGAYTGDVVFDTDAEVTFTVTSTSPAATRTFTTPVDSATPTTAAAPTTTVDTPATATATATATDESSGESGDDDTGSSAPNIIANGALLLIGAAGAFFAIRWWRNRRSTT